MIELKHDHLNFSFPEVHPEAKLSIQFQRTLRIPYYDNTYPLPPGLGAFPLLRHVDDFAANVPEKWLQHGGVMMPMYQSEAMWINFDSDDVDRRGAYPFAIRFRPRANTPPSAATRGVTDSAVNRRIISSSQSNLGLTGMWWRKA